MKCLDRKLTCGWLLLGLLVTGRPLATQAGWNPFDRQDSASEYGSYESGYEGGMMSPGGAYPGGPAYCPPGYDPGYGPQFGQTSGYELIPNHRDQEPFQDPAHDFLASVAQNSWLRLEYLNWSMREPGETLLGADVSGETNQSEPYLALERSSSELLVGKTGTLSEIELANQNGIRGTWGIDMHDGTLETNVWYLAKHEQTIDEGEFFTSASGIDPLFTLLGVDSAIFVPLKFQGQVPASDGSGITTTGVVAFDSSYQAKLETSLFGAESNYVWNYYRPDAAFQWRPTAGVRYVHFNEQLTITGTSTRPDTRIATIESTSYNNVIGPQVGLRGELRDKWFSVSAEPKFFLGANRHSSRVKTTNLYDSTSGQVASDDQTYELTPGFNIAVQGKVNISEHLSVFVGYDLLYLYRVARPFDSINYNDNGPDSAPGVVLDLHFTDFLVQGVSVGGEYRY